MKTTLLRVQALSAMCTLVCGVACGDDDDGGATLADRLGVGMICSNDDDCPDDEPNGFIQECLPFKGGYCGLSGCVDNVDCPSGSACVTHGGANYCFRICLEKIDCNRNRTPDAESNCSANVDFVDGKQGWKACVPPSSD